MSIHMNEVPQTWKPVLSVDIESTGLDPFIDHILSVTIFDGTDYWIYLHTHGFNKIKAVLEDEKVLKIFQNAKFDMKMLLQQKKIEVHNIYDTMLADAVIYMGLHFPMDLASIVARHVGELLNKDEVQSFLNHPGFDKQPLTDEQIEYMCKDVQYLFDIRKAQLELISTRKLGKVIALEFEIVPAVIELELGGLRLDIPMWFEMVEYFTKSIADIEQTVKDIIGNEYILQVPAVKKGEPIVKEIPCESINLGSSQQMTALFNKRFNVDVQAINEKELSAYLEKHMDEESDGIDVIHHLLRKKKYSKRLTYNYQDYVHAVTGKVHPNFHQVSTFNNDKNEGTVTGRLSCSNPNVQQVPRPEPNEPNMRRLWRGDTDDYVIVCADYAQQEPRIMAHLSLDEKLLKACSEIDVYIACGELAYGETIDKHDPRRHIMKTCMLASFYGAGPATMHINSGLPEDECTLIRDFIREKFPTAAAFGNKMRSFAETYKFVPTALGRRRYGEFSYMEAVNMPVQGTAADMFKMALARINKVLTEEKKCGMLDINTRGWNLVHDEIEVHAHKDQVEHVAELVKREMEAAAHDICPDVLHLAEVHWDYRWDKN